LETFGRVYLQFCVFQYHLIHLEATSDLTTKKFVAAFSRFSARLTDFNLLCLGFSFNPSESVVINVGTRCKKIKADTKISSRILQYATTTKSGKVSTNLFKSCVRSKQEYAITSEPNLRDWLG